MTGAAFCALLLAMKGIEFNLLKFHRREDGWSLSLLEIQNHNNGANWSLTCLEYSGRMFRMSFYGA